jgi:predicted O-methyltransferase YrrM
MFGKTKASDPPMKSDPKGPLDPRQPLPETCFTPTTETVPAICCHVPGFETQWYPEPLVGAPTLANFIVEAPYRYIPMAVQLLRELTPDEYARYTIEFYEEGLRRYGGRWNYADIVTVLLGLAEALRPRRYLEIGVRRGRSVCAVGRTVPDCEMIMFDMWVKNYAGIDNPGPEFVKAELEKVGQRGRVEFINGNSHETLPKYFAENPGKTFDLITVDGDHTNIGAAQDICDVLPRLAVGGAIVFDDVCHPKTPGLRDVWRRMVVENPRLSSWTYDEVGYGIGFAIRKY